MKSFRLLCLLTLATFTSVAHSQQTIDISDYGWYISIEKDVDWTQEWIVSPDIPPEDVDASPPSEGWTSFQNDISEDILLPSIIEDHIWNRDDLEFEKNGEFQGIAWYYTFFDIPSYWRKKKIFLRFEKVEMKAELYLNEQLVAHEMVNGSPFEIDITDLIERGTLNLLAVRVTDPFGSLDSNKDLPPAWKNYARHSTNGNGGLVGKVFLSARDDVYLSDVIIRNRENGESIQVTAEVTNTNSKLISGNLSYSLLDGESGKEIARKERYLDKIFGSWVISMGFSKSDFEENPDFNQLLWTPENQNTYKVQVRWNGKDRSSSSIEKEVAFRWMDIEWEADSSRLFINDELFEKSVNEIKTRKGVSESLNSNLVLAKDELFISILPAWENNDSEFDRFIRIEKSKRWIKMQRSNPLLIMYRADHRIKSSDIQLLHEHMRTLHSLDPTRMILFANSIVEDNLYSANANAEKQYMYILPYTDEIITQPPNNESIEQNPSF